MYVEVETSRKSGIRDSHFEFVTFELMNTAVVRHLFMAPPWKQNPFTHVWHAACRSEQHGVLHVEEVLDGPLAAPGPVLTDRDHAAARLSARILLAFWLKLWPTSSLSDDEFFDTSGHWDAHHLKSYSGRP